LCRDSNNRLAWYKANLKVSNWLLVLYVCFKGLVAAFVTVVRTKTVFFFKHFLPEGKRDLIAIIRVLLTFWMVFRFKDLSV